MVQLEDLRLEVFLILLCISILVNEVANGFLFEIEYPTFYRKNIKNLVTTAIGLNESFDNVWIEK